MQTTQATFVGKHDGKDTIVRFDRLEDARHRVTVKVGGKRKTITTDPNIKPCITHAALLAAMLQSARAARPKTRRVPR